MSSWGDSPPGAVFGSHSFHARQNRIPLVAKAGSLTSPPILSPGPDGGDFFRYSHGDFASEVLPSFVPSAHSIAGMPLFSPSEGSLHPPTGDIMMMQTSTAFADANPVDYSLPTPPLAEPERLRLPSFNLLGIAAPHPDDIECREVIAPFEGTAGFASPWLDGSIDDEQFQRPDCKHSTQPHRIFPTHTREVRPSLRPSLELMTPPEDVPGFHFSLPVGGPGDSGRSGDFLAVAPASNITQESGAPPGTVAAASSDPIATAATEEEDGSDLWLEAAVSAIIHSVHVSTLSGSTLRVLSHALPSPSIPGHSFPQIIDRLRVSSPSSPIMWINLLHAVPGRFNLADLPTTPPSTPGLPLGGGDDYFTTKIFESAVSAVDFEAGVTPTHTHSRYNPLAAPSSINLSVVERYIPPTSGNEFANLFNIRAPSLLVDRMTELSPGNGCLVFVYPTKRGAETFLREYLGPILDPMLRSMVVINNFTADLSTAVGRMLSVERLPDFDTVRQQTFLLCNELSQGGPLAKQRLHGSSGQFSLAYAGTHEVELERSVWADWWIKQEKPRIRVQVANYFANRMPGEGEITPANLIQELLDGVASRPYATLPTSKIEVGVYVVARAA